MRRGEAQNNEAAPGSARPLNVVARRRLRRMACVLVLALLTAVAAHAQTVTGSGTAGRVPVFTGTSSVGNSVINQNGERVEIGTAFDPAFALQPTSGSPDAGYIRFGDNTGWKLHIARSRERSAGPLNTGPRGILMTINDNGNVSVFGDFSARGVLARSGSFSFLFAGSCQGCNPPSDRNLKANFAAVDPRLVLDRLASVPILTWNYKNEPASVRHIGATAQDFRAAFQLGDERTLSVVDAHGVTMAAVQGLRLLSLEQRAQIEAQREQIRRQQREIDALKRLVCRSNRRAPLCRE